MATPHRRLLEKGASDNLIFNRTTSDDSYATDTSEFDTNMVIILAVLLCALMFALGLNMVARCGIPYINRSSNSSSSRSSPQPAAVPGIKKRALRQLPHGLYGLGPDLSTTECPICLGEFVHGEKIRVLPKCSHGFHVACIDTWLMSHASCPNCRVCVLDPPPCTAEPRFDGRVAPNLS